MNARIAQLPWQLAQWPELPEATSSTGISPGQGAALLCEVEADLGTLAPFCLRVRLSGKEYNLIELPGPAVRGPEMEKLSIGSQGGLSAEFIPASLPKWRHGHETTMESGHLEYDGFIDDALTRMHEARDHVLKLAKDSTSGHVFWPSFLDVFVGFRDDDRAGRGLIVDISAKMPEYLRDIAFGPKKVLRRLREESRLDRMQELDVHCLLDFAQRPGRTAVEKAGQKQRLLSVKREETFNTLENRVTLDFYRRSLLATKSYTEHNKHLAAYDETTQPSGSKRLAQVIKYGKYCHSYLSDPLWSGVASLSEPCRAPNYALAQNPLYVEVWREYLKLLRYANLRETVWRWPRKAWADIVRIFVSEGIRQTFDGSEAVSLSTISVRIGGTIEKGTWYRRAECGFGWLIRSKGVDKGSLFLLDRTEISGFSKCDALSLANADFYIAWLPCGSRNVFYLPIWAMVGDVRWKDRDYATSTRKKWTDDLAESLAALAKQTDHSSRIAGGLIIRADWMSERPGCSKMLVQPLANSTIPVWLFETHAYGGWQDEAGMIGNVVKRLIGNDTGN